MTLQPLNHFKCNRCGDEAYLPIANTPSRSAPPEGWITLWVNETTTAAFHYCPPCSFGLKGYLQGAALSTGPLGQASDPPPVPDFPKGPGDF